MSPTQLLFGLMVLGIGAGWITGRRMQRHERYYEGFITFVCGLVGCMISGTVAIVVVGIWAGRECVTDYVVEVGGCDRSGYCGVRGSSHRGSLSRPVTGDAFDTCGPLQWKHD